MSDKAISDVIACVIDNGLFLEVAIRLAREYKKVYYHVPWEDEFPLINDGIIGNGLEEVEWISDPFKIVNNVDLWVFPDVMRSGWQLHLESLGKRVWGSRDGDSLELHRIKFKELQKRIGLAVPKYEVMHGFEALSKHLKNVEDKYIKLSVWRGTMESWHHVNWKTSEFFMDSLAVKMGAAKELFSFLVEDAIPTEIETGWDGYIVDGKFPTQAIQGYEIKGHGFIGSVQSIDQMPHQLIEVNDKLSPVFKEFRYRNWFSSELRIIKDGTAFLIDPCARCPNPGIAVEMELCDNLGEIVYHGAEGELVEPEMSHNFGIQVAVRHDHDGELWKRLPIPKTVRQWFKLMEFCKVEDDYVIVPRYPFGEKVGWIMGIGDTLKKALEHLQENIESIKGLPVEIKMQSIFEALEEIHKAEDQNIPFTEQTVPEPETVLQ